MIIWINGAFGSGKTQTANELHRRILNSFLYDPENAGFFIRKNIPEELNKGDFQNYLMWREFNYSMLRYIAKEYAGIIIVPMTISNPLYFSEIIGRLRSEGIEVKHFVLYATKDTILKRLRRRGKGNNSWAARQIDRCILGFNSDIFKEHIDTDKISIQVVAEKIAKLSDIELLPDRRSNLKKVFGRFITQIKNIRL